MSAGRRIAAGVTRWLPSENPRTVCPPGRLRPGGGARPSVIVASMARSGTHLLMDAVFNHFPAYRRRPLYLDLLLCEWQDRMPGRALLEQCPGYVVKTHYDGVVYGNEAHRRRILDLVELGAVVLVLERGHEALRRSQKAFMGDGFDAPLFERQSAAFFRFWAPLETLRVRFEDLVDGQGFVKVVGDLSQALGLEAGPLRRPVRQALANYRNKLLTRLLGGRAPVISTGIGFRQTEHPPGT